MSCNFGQIWLVDVGRLHAVGRRSVAQL